MLAGRPTNIDDNPVKNLDYWVRRACSQKGRHASEYHYLYQGIIVVVHPSRAARLELDGRRVTLIPEEDSKRYQGRGWLQRFVSDIEAAIQTLKDGGGDSIELTLGDKIRSEILRRNAGTPNEVPLEDLELWQFLHDDELPVLLGAWMHRIGLMSCRYELTRQDVLSGFHPTNDEFDLGRLATSPSAMWTTLSKLATARRELAFERGGIDTERVTA